MGKQESGASNRDIVVLLLHKFSSIIRIRGRGGAVATPPGLPPNKALRTSDRRLDGRWCLRRGIPVLDHHEGKNMWPSVSRDGTIFYVSDAWNGEYYLYRVTREGTPVLLTEFDTSVKHRGSVPMEVMSFHPRLSAVAL